MGFFHLTAFVVESVVVKGDVSRGHFRYVSEQYPPIDEENDLRQIVVAGLIPFTQFRAAAMRNTFFMGLAAVRRLAKETRERERKIPHPILSLRKQHVFVYDRVPLDLGVADAGREKGVPKRKRKRRKKT